MLFMTAAAKARKMHLQSFCPRLSLRMAKTSSHSPNPNHKFYLLQNIGSPMLVSVQKEKEDKRKRAKKG